jgi:Leucine-rich repeat (LRR) protein
MSPLLQSLFARYARMSWGQRGYLLTVLLSLIVFGCAGINARRARSYESMHRRIVEAGARSTRSVTVVDDAEEAYFMAILGDFSGVALTGVIGSGPDCTIDAALLRDLRRYGELTSLRLPQVPLKSADFQQIWGIENLARLNLSFTSLTDADLAGVEKLEGLDTLELQYTPLTDASVPRLAKLPGLSKLDITGTDITAEGAERLRHDYQLLQGSQSTTQVIHRPAPSPRYREAVIRLLPTSSYGSENRSGGAGMRLQLKGEAWKGHQQDIPLLAELTDVDNVTISRMPLSSDLLTALVALPNVRVLNISEISSAGYDLSRFAACRNLRTLRLSNMQLDEPFLRSLAQLESLEALSIYSCQLSPGACRAIANVKNLRSLQLRQLVVSPDELSQLLSELQCSSQLRLLDLGSVPIDNTAIERLAHLTQLVSLGLGSQDVDDAAVPQLSTFTHLQQLDISSTAISSPSPQSQASGATQLEVALIPAGVRVVHPRSNMTTVALNLADLAAKTQADAAAATKAKASPGATGGATPAKPMTP